MSRDDAIDAYLARERPRPAARPPRSRRTRVVVTLVVSFAIGYALLFMAAASVAIEASVVPLLFAIPAFMLLPAVAAGMVAAVGAGKPIARVALAVLILGLPAAMVAGWLSVSGGAYDNGSLAAQLVVTACITVPALIGHGYGTSTIPSQP